MKNILIAGASKGIGLAAAQLLSEKNHLYTISRNLTPELEALHTSFQSLDLVHDSADQLEGLPDELHGLIYCPGSINLKPFNRLSAEDFLDDYRKNVIGAVSLIRKMLPALKKSGNASILLFSTVAAKTGMPYHASIAAAKSAVEGLTKSLAAEFAPLGIRVNAIAPSLTDTSLAGNLLNTPEKREAAAKRHPLQRTGKPEEMAAMAEFLLSDAASWITGQIIGIDGGLGSLKL